MAGDDVISEDSALESDLDSSASNDDCEHQRNHHIMTPEPEVVKPTPQPPMKRQRKPTSKLLESCVGADAITDCKPKVAKKACHASASGTAQQIDTPRMSSSTAKKDRMLMKDWLITVANSKQVNNVQWYDAERTMIKIPWKHGSRSGWTQEDCHPYRAWAIYTGKYGAANDDEPKRWKANFRCALNSLPDVDEVKQLSQSRGSDPYKVYRLYPAMKSRKSQCTKKPRKSRRNKVEQSSHRKQQQQEEEEEEQQQPSNLQTVGVNSRTTKSTAFVDKLSPTAHRMSASAQPMKLTYQTVLPIPLPVTSLQLAMNNNQTSPNGSSADTCQHNSLLMTPSYSAVIPTTVEEMSCDDDDESNMSDGYVSDVGRNFETLSAVDSLLQQTYPSPNGRPRHTRSDSSTISESSSGYSTDRVESPAPAHDPQLDYLDSFDLEKYCYDEDINAVPQFDSCPEMNAEETHGYVGLLGLQYLSPASYFCLPTNQTVL